LKNDEHNFLERMETIIENKHTQSNQVSLERDVYLIKQNYRKKNIKGGQSFRNSMEMSNNKRTYSPSRHDQVSQRYLPNREINQVSIT
jgi:hypothetical protein